MRISCDGTTFLKIGYHRHSTGYRKSSKMFGLSEFDSPEPTVGDGDTVDEEVQEEHD